MQFYQTLRGAYGDEGAQLAAHLETMTAALAAWDGQIRDAESQLQPRLKGADAQTALQVHTVLASLYLDRSRFDDALREFEADDRASIPPRAAFHRYKGLIYQAIGRPADAADAFRAAWLRDPADPQNAYRLIVQRSAETTAQEVEQALAMLARVEGELTRRQRAPAGSPFRTVQAIDDDAGGAIAFVPPAIRAVDSRCCRTGQYEEGLAALRAAVAADPLVADAALRSEPAVAGHRRAAAGLAGHRDRASRSGRGTRAPIRRRLTGSSERRTGSAAMSPGACSISATPCG